MVVLVSCCRHHSGDARALKELVQKKAGEKDLPPNIGDIFYASRSLGLPFSSYFVTPIISFGVPIYLH